MDMIEGEQLLSSPDGLYKNPIDLIGYILCRLQAHNENYVKVFPVVNKLEGTRFNLRGKINSHREEIRELRKNYPSNQDEVHKSIEEQRPDPDQEKVWAESVETFIASNPQGGTIKDIDHGSGCIFEGPGVNEYFLTEELKRAKKRYDALTVLIDKLSNADHEGARIELRELTSILHPDDMKDLAEEVTKCFYERAEILDHINRDLNIEQPSREYKGRKQIIEQFIQRRMIGSWSRILEVLKENNFDLRHIKQGKKDIPVMSEKDFNELGI